MDDAAPRAARACLLNPPGIGANRARHAPLPEFAMPDGKPEPQQEVFTLLVQVGRRQDDGLPEGATGAGILCYAAARDEEEAVREAVALLKTAGMAPLEVTGYGTLADREAEGEVVAEEQALMERARLENAVVVAEVTPFFDAKP
jgi:hypothetical protein